MGRYRNFEIPRLRYPIDSPLLMKFYSIDAL